MAMAQASMESVVEDTGNQTPISVVSDERPAEQAVRAKGKKKLLQSLQRISSTPSMLKLGRSSGAGYRGTGGGSISCISLSSTTSPYYNVWGNSYGSNGWSTAPTSVPGTPGPEPNSVAENARPKTARSRTATTAPVPSEAKLGSRPGTSSGIPAIEEDYFSQPVEDSKTIKRRDNFDFWGDMPSELKMQILQLLSPKELVRCSVVSKSWHRMCFDGQLWSNLDTSGFYRDIPAEGLIKIINYAGPFVRDLNLRGCVQLWESWRGSGISDACRNLENLSLEGCRIDRNSIHNFLYQNPRLHHINLSGLAGVTNSSMKIIAQCCPNLEYLNISWCNNVDTRGLRRVVEACPQLRDLRAGEMRGLDDKDFMNELYKRNTLERLILMNCDSLNEESLMTLIEGVDSEMDFLTGRPMVPMRKFKHIDLSRCRNITDAALKTFTNNMPDLEGLQLSKCRNITDAPLLSILPTVPKLTHLDLEELDLLTNATLQELSRSPCKDSLQHLSISYCENLGDSGMLPVIKSCPNLRSLDLDNTRISDLVLAEAAAMVRQRCSAATPAFFPRRSVSHDTGAALVASGATGPARPKIGLRMVVYDCQNVTWTGIREVLSRNSEIRRPAPAPFTFPNQQQPSALQQQSTSSQTQLQQQPPPKPQQDSSPSHPHQIIALKVFYGYQPTVTEHTRRVLRGDLASASRLERKWADYMMCTEEAGAAAATGRLGAAAFGAGFGVWGGVGMGNRRRRRRVREAHMMAADEEVGFFGPGTAAGGGGLGGGVGGLLGNVGAFGGLGTGIGGRRRRARSGGGCNVM